jgi:hypothetical protein
VLFDRLWAVVLKNYTNYRNSPAGGRYIAQFIDQTGLLTQFQHVEYEEDDEPEGLSAMKQSPEDAGF